MKALPVLNAAAWWERLQSLPSQEKVLAFYEHRVGAICTNAHCLFAPLDDHLVHRGDGVFESLRFSRGGIFQIDAHLARLKESAATLNLVPPCSWEDIRSILIQVAKVGNQPEGTLKLLMGRGPGGFGVDPRECPEASLYIVAVKGHVPPESWWEKGLTACKSRIPAKQEYLAGIKSTNYLPNVLMTAEAAERGVDVAFSFDKDGFLAEAAIANVGVVDKEGRLLFPHFRHVLPGTTTLRAKALAQDFMDVILTDITEETIYSASEILVLGTTCECVAVTHFNGRAIGGGQPGPVAKKLRKLLQAALYAGSTPFLETQP